MKKWIIFGVLSSSCCMLAPSAHADAYNLYSWSHSEDAIVNEITTREPGMIVTRVISPVNAVGHSSIVSYSSITSDHAWASSGIAHGYSAKSDAVLEADGTPIDFYMFTWLGCIEVPLVSGGSSSAAQVSLRANGLVEFTGAYNPNSLNSLTELHTLCSGIQFLSLNTEVYTFHYIDTDTPSPSSASLAENINAHAEVIIP